ncbi:MAG: NAD(P)-dependent oxidoreductase, partial [bacterium]|nr:NAD(P)-dependent oxidoreductase [bacterium]
MAQWKVLISTPYFQAALPAYARRMEELGIVVVAPAVHERLSEAELLPLVHDIDGALCGDDRFTDRVFAAAPRLRIISKWGTGIDSIDCDAAARRGIVVKNVPDAFSVPVAETAFAFLMNFARQVHWTDQDIRRGVWEKRRGRTLAESTLGIIGVGNIGKAFARRAHAFGMRLLGYDAVAPDAAFVQEVGMTVTDLPMLLRESDYVSLHCALSATTRHLIDRTALAQMQRHAVIVNTARGGLIDERALVDALVSHQIGGA